MLKNYKREILLAHKYRLSLDSVPSQSSFRVLSLFFYQPYSSSNNSQQNSLLESNESNDNFDDYDPFEHFVVGTNDEPCHIGGSICAERAAMVQFRLIPYRQITHIVIVSDAPSEITPGCLCREFMASNPKIPWDVPIILSGSQCKYCPHKITLGDTETTSPFPENITNDTDEEKSSTSCNPCSIKSSSRHDNNTNEFRHQDGDHDPDLCQHDYLHEITTLRDIYPYPSPYVRMNVNQAINFGRQFMLRSVSMNSNLIYLQEQLFQKAMTAAQSDVRNDLHPIQYGAAILFKNGSMFTACQKKALEYGCSLDAVTQLAPFLEDQRQLMHRYSQTKPSSSNVSSSSSISSASFVSFASYLSIDESATAKSNRPILLIQVDQFGIAHAPFAKARAFLTEYGYGDCHVLVHNADATEMLDIQVKDLVPSAPDMDGGLLVSNQ